MNSTGLTRSKVIGRETWGRVVLRLLAIRFPSFFFSDVVTFILDLPWWLGLHVATGVGQPARWAKLCRDPPETALEV